MTDGLAKVTGGHLSDNGYVETETDVTVVDLSGEGIANVEFALSWGKKSGREFSLIDADDIRAVARVLAGALGTVLHDEAESEDHRHSPECLGTPVIQCEGCGTQWAEIEGSRRG